MKACLISTSHPRVGLKEIPSTKFSIVGDGILLGEVKRLVKKLKVAE